LAVLLGGGGEWLVVSGEWLVVSSVGPAAIWFIAPDNGRRVACACVAAQCNLFSFICECDRSICERKRWYKKEMV
jgi:hypothetical protein